ncbi:MAG: ketoacyl-ACP synthase III [Planctomycetales bacterium]|nr:ketoacyl-ACP synthase III [Planctomycetales bacterium]
MKHAMLGPVAVHFPQRVETNEQLQAMHPDWDMAAIFDKTGIARRYVAEENECASDLGVAAARKLLAEHNIDPASVDYLLFCTQTPDYPLPTTACLMQERLGLRSNIGAIDFNQGCSGFVYGLSLAEGLICSGAVKRILFVTAETYSKYIHASDRSLRTIFSDAAAATLIDAVDEKSLSGFQFGTDGTGADTLMVTRGGARAECDAHRPRHRKRWPSDLYMDGPSLINFTVGAVPRLVADILSAAGVDKEQIDLYLMHQATWKMLDLLRQRLGLAEDRLPIRMENVGNTVSCTLPILLSELRSNGRLRAEAKNLLVGFGVGWSWAGCVWQDIWRNR